MNIHDTRTYAAVIGLAVLGAVAVPAISTVSAGGAVHARAGVGNVAGDRIGFAKFTEDGTGGIHVNVKVSGLSPGLHGIHIHGVGSCVTGASPAFTSAGSHHNPEGVLHGAHAGDLPNLVVDAEGRGTLNAHLAQFTLSAGPTTLLDNNGSAVVVHAAQDDYVTDPTGNSGGRIACGVITSG